MRKLLARDFNAHEKQGRLLDIFLNQHALHSNNKNLNWSKNLNNLSNIELVNWSTGQLVNWSKQSE